MCATMKVQANKADGYINITPNSSELGSGSRSLGKLRTQYESCISKLKVGYSQTIVAIYPPKQHFACEYPALRWWPHAGHDSFHVSGFWSGKVHSAQAEACPCFSGHVAKGILTTIVWGWYLEKKLRLDDERLAANLLTKIDASSRLRWLQKEEI